jgi:hypothetical protein
VFWNIHNFAFIKGVAESVADQIGIDLERAEADRLSFAVFVAGDFNFLAPGELRISLDKPDRKNEDRVEPFKDNTSNSSKRCLASTLS